MSMAFAQVMGESRRMEFPRCFLNLVLRIWTETVLCSAAVAEDGDRPSVKLNNTTVATDFLCMGKKCSQAFFADRDWQTKLADRD